LTTGESLLHSLFEQHALLLRVYIWPAADWSAMHCHHDMLDTTMTTHGNWSDWHTLAIY
jgi:hypothetical protein